MLFWVYPESPGPLIHFNPKGWGVHLWITRLNQLYFRLMPRKKTGRRVKRWLAAGLNRGLGTTSRRLTTTEQVWRRCGVMASPIAQRNVGKFPSGLATNYPIMIGKSPSSRRVFRGKLACSSCLTLALTRAEILALQKKCFRPNRLGKIVQTVKAKVCQPTVPTPR
ncbi:hypothetical protein OS493_040431, partial [Desmophyllum pertusum]